MNYSRIYDDIISRAKGRELTGYKEKHHVYPKCLGGDDSPDNLVDLTAREHFICHLILAREYDNHKLWSAVWLMSTAQRYGGRHYEWLRIRFGREHSQYMLGKSFATAESKQKALNTKRAKGTLNLSEETKRKISEATQGRVIPTTDQKRLKNSLDSRDRRWVNNGSSSCMAKGEKLKELLNCGWILGRLKTPSLLAGTQLGGKCTGGYNRGKPMSEEQRSKCQHTFFKRGQIPHNKKSSQGSRIQTDH